MDQYPSPYVSIVPRLVPSQYSPKKIGMIDEGNQYLDNNSGRIYTSPTTMLNRSLNNPPLSTRTQLINNEDNTLANQSFISNNIENGFYPRSKSRIYHEPLKDNSGDINRINSYSKSVYPINDQYDLYENSKRYSNENNRTTNNYPNLNVIIIIIIIIGLFALTALAISIYLLVKISHT
ncbi:unnamed protein product [Rotaria sordida]|uniref:Uncharacterized protein n=1 Tax=Rotaria sordida TaxID=392033 RepID=A0A814RNM2_9BILA|nr:unnamed protein product [Rotaria sordida]CAF1135847.1 unnamed protein product [Rotaria sordida]